MRIEGSYTDKDLARMIATDLNVPIYKSYLMVQSMKKNVMKLVESNHRLVLYEFGVFHARLWKPRVGNNHFGGGGKVYIPERYEVNFVPSKLFSKRVRKMIV